MTAGNSKYPRPSPPRPRLPRPFVRAQSIIDRINDFNETRVQEVACRLGLRSCSAPSFLVQAGPAPPAGGMMGHAFPRRG